MEAPGREKSRGIRPKSRASARTVRPRSVARVAAQRCPILPSGRPTIPRLAVGLEAINPGIHEVTHEKVGTISIESSAPHTSAFGTAYLPAARPFALPPVRPLRAAK